MFCDSPLDEVGRIERVTKMPKVDLYNSSGVLVATGYTRVVHGGRGNYVEFDKHDICWEHFEIPPSQEYRLLPRWEDLVYYVEYRSKDTSFVKLYVQKRTVRYADYIVGMCYIAPGDLFTDSLGKCPFVVS